ncbi:hypothetical protein BC835DRAFT_951578 [Cytidiella melzeri]|nr:hypothetical protein BC835DRAFT_951578 [Cytidiella melzeri]
MQSCSERMAASSIANVGHPSSRLSLVICLPILSRGSSSPGSFLHFVTIVTSGISHIFHFFDSDRAPSSCLVTHFADQLILCFVEHSHTRGHRLSTASSTSSFGSASDEPSTSASPSPPPSAASVCGSPPLPTPPTPPTSLPATPALPQPAAKQHRVPERVTLTSTFKPRELLCIDRETGETRFLEPQVPAGISLRNFGIQVPIFATLSDIVVYSPRGNTKAALAVASHFAHAIETKRRHRAARGQTDLLHYNVFVLQASPEEVLRDLPHVVARTAAEVVGSGAHTSGTDALTVSETHSSDPHPLTKHQQCTLRKANTINFAQREKEEMRELTQASEILTIPVESDEERKEFNASSPANKWDPTKGQVFLGNANDVPLPDGTMSGRRGRDRVAQEEWGWQSNDPGLGFGYDICIECDDMAPFPSPAHTRAAEEHIARLEKKWADHCLEEMERAEGVVDGAREIPLRPPPSAGLVVHLPFPSTVTYAGNSILPFVAWLEGLLQPLEARLTVGALRERREKELEARKAVSSTSMNGRPQVRRSTNAATVGHASGQSFGGPSSLPPPTSFPSSFLPPAGSPAMPTTTTANAYTRMRSTSATHLSTPSPSPSTALQPVRSRPLKILIYSADGYTESSSLALCLLMSLRQLSLPEAYLELQVEKRRSFFVYQNEIGPMKRVENRLERNRIAQSEAVTRHGRPAASSVSYPSSSIPTSFLDSLGATSAPGMLAGEVSSTCEPSASNHSSSNLVLARRPRASTLPPMSAVVSDHQLWFDDPRFDGSFPSRVLPFLYLGNLNHASNAYMLHALGITHVVSVGECALVPPDNGGTHCGSTAKPGSLWIEEKEGRIKVLDIKGVCDDGIDSLEPQLPPICEWIDEARRSGGKVLVHCRVGVSRSATVTIAYVMKHLNIPLVDAYLIVRSRRLSVLIQPNMRLLYNLIGWEVRLAQERAGGNKERLGEELARCLNWPCLAKEVHALNEKYLH